LEQADQGARGSTEAGRGGKERFLSAMFSVMTLFFDMENRGFHQANGLKFKHEKNVASRIYGLRGYFSLSSKNKLYVEIGRGYRIAKEYVSRL
jgi:hypothetical protein